MDRPAFERAMQLEENEELFYADTFAEPLSVESAGTFANTLEIVRWAPSAVNKQPWRIVVAGNDVHFYKKHSRGYVGEDGWDIQKIDMGIAMCHFVKGVEEEGRKCEFFISDPGIEVPTGTEYIASFHVTE